MIDQEYLAKMIDKSYLEKYSEFINECQKFSKYQRLLELKYTELTELAKNQSSAQSLLLCRQYYCLLSLKVNKSESILLSPKYIPFFPDYRKGVLAMTEEFRKDLQKTQRVRTVILRAVEQEKDMTSDSKQLTITKPFIEKLNEFEENIQRSIGRLLNEILHTSIRKPKSFIESTHTKRFEATHTRQNPKQSTQYQPRPDNHRHFPSIDHKLREREFPSDLVQIVHEMISDPKIQKALSSRNMLTSRILISSRTGEYKNEEVSRDQNNGGPSC